MTLLSVIMNGLEICIRTHAVTKNPKSIEQLRKIAILAKHFSTKTEYNYEHL